MPLPSFGTIDDKEQTHLDVVSHLSDLVRETRASRDKWAAQADKNTTVYLHGEYPAPLETKRVMNPIQNAILADVVIQTREKIIVTLNPVETGDPGEIYFADEGMYAGMPATPIDPAMAAQMQQPTLAMDPMTGQAAAQPGAPAEAFITVDDKLCTEVWQAVFDRMWKRSRFDGWVKRSLTSNEIAGWNVALYEWDDQERKHRARPMSVWQAYIDPTEETIDEAAYAGIDIVMDAAEAARLHPTFAEKIKESAKSGQPSRPDGDSTLGRADMDYERKVVTLRVFWLRNQAFPMSEEEALTQGAVEQREVIDVPSPVVATPDTNQFADEYDPEIVPSTGDNSRTDIVNGDEGNAAVPPLPPPIVRSALFLPGTDEEVTPDAPTWPIRYGIRQITVIESVVVSDMEVEHAEIPILHNVNRPIPGRPWGIGEPMFLMNAQRAYNTLVDGMVAYAEAFKHPGATMPQTAAEALRRETGKTFVSPGSILEIPDDLFSQFGGKVVDWHVPPPLSDAPMQMSQLLKKDINDQSGHTDAIRGILPSAQTSGRAVELLQESGTQMIQHKSQSTEAMVERLATLMHFSHVWRLSIQDIRAIVSKFPDYILEAVQRKGKVGEFDVDVIVASGSGSVIQAKKQESVEKFNVRDPQTGEPLQGIETTRQELNIDHVEERQRWMVQAQQMMAAQVEQAAVEGKDNPASSE